MDPPSWRGGARLTTLVLTAPVAARAPVVTMASVVRLVTRTAAVVLVLAGSAGAQDGAEPRSVLPYEPVPYSAPKLNNSYTASAEFDPKGMEHLYFITNFFLDIIQRDDSAALGKSRTEVQSSPSVQSVSPI